MKVGKEKDSRWSQSRVRESLRLRYDPITSLGRVYGPIDNHFYSFPFHSYTLNDTTIFVFYPEFKRIHFHFYSLLEQEENSLVQISRSKIIFPLSPKIAIQDRNFTKRHVPRERKKIQKAKTEGELQA